MLTVDGYETPCASCHRTQTEDSQHSTHAAAGLICTDCHVNTNEDTGHTFAVGSDTCIICHGEGIHTSNTNTELETPEATTDDTHAITPPEENSNKDVSGSIPIWASAFFVVVLGFGGYTLFGNYPKKNDDDESQRE